jgi:hypothetical protein
MSVRFASKINQFVKNASTFKVKCGANTSNTYAVRCKSAASTSVTKNALGGTKSPAALKPNIAKSEAQSTPLVPTALAATAGIFTVGLSAIVIENATAPSVPAFDPAGERFDQSTFLGRFSKMILACDPRLLLYSEDETRRSKAMVRDYENLLRNLPENMTEQEMNHALWEAQRISSAALHPDTEEAIPSPFRMSGYVPFNGPICVAMVASTSTPSLLFWSWINQSQNALVNYFNRNASSEMSNETLLKSYGTAVVSALTVAFGLATVIQK